LANSVSTRLPEDAQSLAVADLVRSMGREADHGYASQSVARPTEGYNFARA
jgi:hypothetical protein